jgi:putative MATE family efflux protein
MPNKTPHCGRTMSTSLRTARPRILQLALPTIVGNILFSTVAMIQTKFVGDLGAQAVAAVGASQRVFFALQAILMAIGVGTAALVSRAWGAGDKEEAARVTMASVLIASGASLVIMLIGAFGSVAIASWFGLDSETTHLAAKNIFWLSMFIVGFAVDIILCGALRAAGDVWTPLVFVTIVNVVNVPLLYAFIFGRFGAPAMGASGAAFATGLSLVLGGVFLVGAWMRQSLTIRFSGNVRTHVERFRVLFRLSLPAALEQVVFQFGFFLFLMLVGRFYGTEAFAAYNIGVNMLNIAMVIGFGFSIAGATLVGQNLGAGDPDAARRSGWRACKLAMVSMGALAAIISVFAPELAHFILGNEPLTERYTIQLTYILAAMLPLLGVDFAIGGSLRGAGDTRFPLISTFVSLIVMRCGLAALAVYAELPVFWVYASIIGDYVLKASLLIGRFRSGKWVHAIRRA